MTATKSAEISILEELLVEYVRDMSEWFDFHGTYDLSNFWAAGRAYLAWVGETPVGFALVKDRDVQEVFVRREFRRQRVGEALARYIWSQHPGPWTVRVLQANTPALSFWRRTVPAWAQEVERTINNRPWNIFRW
jgi:predicted acetyltransferase